MPATPQKDIIIGRLYGDRNYSLLRHLDVTRNLIRRVVASLALLAGLTMLMIGLYVGDPEMTRRLISSYVVGVP